MKMILHILRKDLRRHRWEIVLFLPVCATWAWIQASPSNFEWMTERELVSMLLFGLWLLITVRVVQGESLVGDREFWPTRPYRWNQLMVEKAVFLLLCLNLPLLAAQIFLLVHAGIPLSGSLAPGLVFLQLEFIFFLTFPAAVLASITESLVQWVLAVVGVLLFALVMSWLPWSSLPIALPGDENVATLIAMALIVPAFVFVLLWQYARRRAWPARLAFAGAVLVVPLTVLLASTRLVRVLAYPLPNGVVPLQLSFATGENGAGRVYQRQTRQFATDPLISIPVTLVSPDSSVLAQVEGWRVTLSGDNGWTWQTPWFGDSIKLDADAQTGHLAFSIPVALADQLMQRHARARAEVAFALYRLSPPRRIDTAAGRFLLPGGGICRWDPTRMDYGLHDLCVAPLKMPDFMALSIDSQDSTCARPQGAPPLGPGHRASEYMYASTEQPAEFDPNPVRSYSINMGAWEPLILNPTTKGDVQAFFCRGTPLTVRTGALTGKMRSNYELGEIGSELRVVIPPDNE
jgi:hypothetical protein